MRIIALALAAFAFAAPAFAQHEEAPCMAPVAITAVIVEEADLWGFTGYAGSEATPPFLVGSLSPTRDAEDAGELFGAVVFVRGADGWRAFMPQNGETVVAVYGDGARGVIMATQWSSEAPGQSWTLLRSNDGLATGTCVQIDFPDTLNQPTWANESLNLFDLDINARGRGEIIGFARTENRGDLWYAYRTGNGGATWSAPRRISRARQARAGTFTRIVDEEGPAPEALVAELRAYAAGR